ncbi:MAG: cadherin-like domain-containing protein, partial [Burkholderiaceae bacterium]
MSSSRRASSSSRSPKAQGLFSPRSSRLVLEPRILFDGAAAVAGADAMGDAPEHLPQTQGEPQQEANPELLGAALFSPMAADTGSSITIGAAENADSLTVAEHSELNDPSAETVTLDGWKLSGKPPVGGSFTVTVTLTAGAASADSLTDGATSATTLTSTAFTTLGEAEAWLNGLQFSSDPDVELGDTARTVTVTAQIGGSSFSRDITVTPSNDPVKLDDVAIDVTEGDTGRVITAAELGPVDPEVTAGTQDPSQIVYGITDSSHLPQYGYLTLNGERLGVGSVFTQQDVIDGKLAYVHTAGGTADQNMADGFTVRINDGATPIGDSDTARITLNIVPVNQDPSIGGSGIVFEGQPNNAENTGNVGQYILGGTGGDPTDVLDTSVVVLASTTNPASGGTLHFKGTAKIGGMEQYIDRALTAADIAAGFSFLYSQRNGLSYSHDGREGVTRDSFDLWIIDQGGGTGVPASKAGTVDLTIRPVDDDPLLGAAEGSTPTLEATVPDGADGEGHHSVVLTPGMIGARDVDTEDRNLRFVIDYSNTDIDHGNLQIQIGGTWYNLPAGESFSMADITAGNIRYVQTSGALPGETDNFTFKVVDSTNALRWNADGSTYERIGGIYDDPSDSGSALTNHGFTIKLSDLAVGGGGGTPWIDLDRTPDHSDSTYGGNEPGGGGKGTLGEGGYILLKGTGADPLTDPYLSYEAFGIQPEEVIYTFDGFIDDASSSGQAGELQKLVGSSWVTLNRYDTFTQKDVNEGKIRYQHDGDSEKFVSTAKFSVSAGVRAYDAATSTWKQDVWEPTFTFYTKPVNDAPVATGSNGLVIKEGDTVGITGQWLGVSDPDDANSGTTMPGMGDLDTASTRDGENNYAADHDATNPLKFKITALPAGGKLEYYDGSVWVEITDANKDGILLEAGWLTNDQATTRLRFVHDGSETRGTEFKVQAIDRWGAVSDLATVKIQITNVNDAPEIASKPSDLDPVSKADSPSKIGSPSANNPITVTEGAEKTITSSDLQAIDSDSSSKQVQYKITEAPKYGDIMLNGKKLGVGSSFTQDDIENGRVKYVHRGSETPDGTLYDDRFKFTLSDGDKEQAGNEFWIHVDPANDPPTVTVPSAPQITGEDGVNNISGVTVADIDLTASKDHGEVDFIQVTLRLKDADGNVVGSGFTYGWATPSDTTDLWGASAAGGLLVLQGTREQVNQALAGLKLTFGADMDKKYTLEVIADDRLRDGSGALIDTDPATSGGLGANGGVVNQPTTPGGTPGAIDPNIYDWSQSATLVPANNGNIAAKTIELWSSKDNDPPVLTLPSDPIEVHEDVRSRIPGDDIVISDAESAAFDTNITVTISVPSGSLHIGSSGGASSVMPSGADREVVGIAGQGSGTLTLTGRASDIQALLKDSAATGGLYYTSASNVNHDLNGAAAGDVTVSFIVTEGDSAIGIPHAQPAAEGSIALTIVAVNDAPTVDMGSGQVIIDSDQPHAVDGISISDVDADNGYADGEDNGVIQVIVRLQKNTGGNNWAVLSQGEYDPVSGMGIKLSSTTAVISGATVVAAHDGDGDVLVLRGTQAQINAYLQGLRVQFGNAADSNVDALYRLEVIADDRVRDPATGALSDTDAAAGLQPGANGGTVNQQTNLPSVPDRDDFNVYSDTVSGYNIFNVVAATRDLFVSSLNDPGKITAKDFEVNEGSSTVVLNTGNSNFQLDDSDHNGSTSMVTTVTVSKGTITAVGGLGGTVTGLGTDTIIITGATQAEINSRLNALTITLPGADTAAKQDWNGKFDVTVVYNDKGNTGLRPGGLTGDSNDPRSTNGDYSYADPGANDGDASNDNHLVTTRTITVTVNPVNDAPIVQGTGNEVLLPVTEDTNGSSTADTVDNLFSDRFQDSRDQVDNSTATDGLTSGSSKDSFYGVAVVGNTSIPGQGVWEYSTDGTTWTAIPTDVSDGKALILEKTAQVRFNPAADFHGTPGGLSVRLVETHSNADGTADTTSSTATAQNRPTGTIVSLTSNGGTGNTSLYSAGTIALTTTVANVNDAPSLTGDAVLTDTAEDGGGTPMSAADIAGQLTYSDAVDNKTGITGGANAATDITAIAIVGNSATSAQGVWQYTLDGGDTWDDVPTDAANGKAIVLQTGNADHQVRFVPKGNYNGTPGGLIVRGADGTLTGSPSGPQDISAAIGGTNPWSANSGTVGIEVTPANDAPDFTHIPTNPAVTENGETGTGASVPPTALLGGGVVSDIDLDTTAGLDPSVFGGGTITVKLTDGTFTNSGDVLRIATGMDGVASVTGGTGGADLVITLTDTATKDQVAAVLAAIEYLNTSDNPTNFGDNGTRDYSIILSDGKNVQGGNNAGSGTALTKTVTGTITITAVNDPPTATDDAKSITEDSASVSGNVKTGTDGSLDTDPDNTNAELKVTGIQGPGAATSVTVGDGTNSSTGTRVDGQYGYLIIGSDGSYTYHLDNDNPVVNALGDGDPPLTETFTYTISDPGGLTDSADLVITIDGRTDGAPGVVPDDMNGPGTGGDATVYESGLRDVPVSGESKTATGTIDLTAPDNLVSFTIAGEYVSGDASHTGTEITLTLAQLQALGTGATVVINTADGQLELTGFTVTSDSGKPVTAGTLSYRYTLAERLDHTGATEASSQDTIALKITDGKGAEATGNLNVLIIDDAPTARPDTNEVAEDATAPITGNVIGGTGAAGTDVADTVGA